MPRPIGFSTGCLLPGNTRQSLRIITEIGATAVELSALRAQELPELLDTLADHTWDRLVYVSVHAPSRYAGLTESEIVTQLQPALAREWSLTIHPDAVRDWDVWARLGRLSCIENMDNRKAAGRTVKELEDAFRRLPEATFCLDLGHARNIDPTLSLARELIAAFGTRLRQVHLSEVDGRSTHQPLSPGAMEDYQHIASLISRDAAILLETPVEANGAAHQLELARSLFA